MIISKTTTLAGVFLESPSATSSGCILVLCWCSKWYHLRMAGEYWLIAEILACTFSRGFLSRNLFSQRAETDFPCQLQGANKIDNMWLLANVRILIYIIYRCISICIVYIKNTVYTGTFDGLLVFSKHGGLTVALLKIFHRTPAMYLLSLLSVSLLGCPRKLVNG